MCVFNELLLYCRPLGTTFKGKYGCVDYWVKAFLERPSVPPQETKKHFEVQDPVDINTPDLLVIVIFLGVVGAMVGLFARGGSEGYLLCM